MLNCFNATRLMSDARERPLRFQEKIALRFHTMMCAGCRNFDHQMGTLHTVSRKFVNRPETDTTPDDQVTPENEKKGRDSPE